MKKETILEILRRMEEGEAEITITSQTPLHDGATLTQFEAEDCSGCCPGEVFYVSCITYEGDEEHLFHPYDWLGGPAESAEDVAETLWIDQDGNEAVMLNGLPQASTC